MLSDGSESLGESPVDCGISKGGSAVSDDVGTGGVMVWTSTGLGRIVAGFVVVVVAIVFIVSVTCGDGTC